MTSVAKQRHRRAQFIHAELLELQNRLRVLAAEAHQDLQQAKADVEAEERREQAQRVAQRLGV